ncbi:MAG: helix-turn-helix domain-containing protein [Ilumatobacteraceae bacterium]
MANAFNVLERLAALQPVGVSALARDVELDKNGVQRILLTLARAGWARQVEDAEWIITSRVLQVAGHFTSGLREVAHPMLVELQRTTDETVLLFAREDASMVVLDAIDSTQPLRMTVPIGMAVPLVQGAAFDAFLPDQQRALLPIATRVPAASAVRTVRRNGYFVIDELYPNAIAAGAPIFVGDVPVATITVVGPKARINTVAARHLGELAAMAAARVTAALAQRPRRPQDD